MDCSEDRDNDKMRKEDVKAACRIAIKLNSYIQ